MIEVIILAGGLGTRLRALVHDLPKSMAAVAGRPFLWWLMTRLQRQGVGRVILSVGYKSEIIRDYFGDEFNGVEIAYSIEGEPLGTGGAIKSALELAREPQVIVLNGDTYATIDLQEFLCRFEMSGTGLAIAVTRLDDVARYGAIGIDEKSGTVTSFDEKRGPAAGGYINAGVYALRRDLFTSHPVSAKFSFERDFLPKYLAVLRPVAIKGVRAFIDIGALDDYARAQELVPMLAAG